MVGEHAAEPWIGEERFALCGRYRLRVPVDLEVEHAITAIHARRPTFLICWEKLTPKRALSP
jgi:hypothetical protein